jgi:signal peptidase I
MVMNVLLLAVLAAAFRTWVMSPVIVTGVSMLPTCHDGELALLNKVSYRWRLPQRGDLVCVWTGKELYDKRIVGLPGDEIAIRDGSLYINGNSFSEPYVKVQSHWNLGVGKLGPRTYVVIGDNRSLPQNQAVIAIVNRDRIMGRLILLL